mmetsp:Transcript_27160/g.24023  ORF Transcript_27160/g.24023 Transcript_27160/m.24023 type:complete len:85 (+) Transcript_27160:451-705(+)
MVANEHAPRVPTKPTTSHGKDRGRSHDEKLRAYNAEYNSANNSFNLNSSFQHGSGSNDKANHSFDYYNPGRMSLNDPSITIYSS